MLRNIKFILEIPRFYSNSAYRNIYNMKTAYFRYVPADPYVQINFHYTNVGFNIDRDFNFSRNVSETISVFLDRIKNNIEKELNKKNKKKKNQKDVTNTDEGKQLPEILIQMFKKDDKLESDITFTELLNNRKSELNDLTLRIIDEDFRVAYNTPWIVGLALPNSILAGFFLYPSKLELQFADKTYSKGVWYKALLPEGSKVQHVEWQKIHEGLIYNTTTADIGHHIKFECTPGNSEEFGPRAEIISKTEVQAGPGVCPFEDRHMFTQEKLSGNKFRLTSYNILADLYADSDYTRKELFPYCPPYALSIDYRKQLFLKEIIGYNSDIICLQEVDSKTFHADLCTVFETYDFKGHFQKKGKTAEGLATFYNANRFNLLKTYGFTLGENLSVLDNFSDLWSKIENNEQLVQRIADRSTALQVNTLRSKDTGHVLMVANTHLYFHPDADHVRLLQAGLCMLYLKDLYEEVLKDINLSRSKLSLIFCGDFNSVPECGIYKLMTEKFVDEDFIDWSSNENEAVKGVSLSQPFNIKSACGCPKYTNFTTLFAACLDYIFYQTDNLQVEEVIPLPSEEELCAHGAIPSVVFPSDHIALVADFKFKEAQ